MAEISRVHGSPAAGAFYGYQAALIKIDASNKFDDDAVDATTKVITPAGYSGAVKALEQFASIIWLGANTDNDHFSAIVDYATYNGAVGLTTAGANGALKDALASECGGAGSDYTVNVYTTLTNIGTFTA